MQPSIIPAVTRKKWLTFSLGEPSNFLEDELVGLDEALNAARPGILNTTRQSQACRGRMRDGTRQRTDSTANSFQNRIYSGQLRLRTMPSTPRAKSLHCRKYQCMRRGKTGSEERWRTSRFTTRNSASDRFSRSAGRTDAQMNICSEARRAAVGNPRPGELPPPTERARRALQG